MTTVNYQVPESCHAEKLETFFMQTLKENFPYLPKEAQVHFQNPWKKELLIPRLEKINGLLSCAWDNDKIIGLIYGTPAEGNVGTIIWLMVGTSYQNQKIGTQLLSYAKEHYKNQQAHKIKLTVHNEKAVKFYLREGFIKEALHKKHWWELDFWSLAYFIDSKE